ncbi:MAG: 3-deoxy-D-manno-octulosonic acid kinase, partial [Thiohalophilus sp.]
VPQPVAAQVIRDGVYYTADIMTRRIGDARTVAQLLVIAPFEATRWQAIGQLIRRFHEQGVYHADLNANNIMLDSDEKFYLIDFDRGTFKGKRRSWQQRNLKRLRRSLEKLKRANAKFYFEDSDWQHLLTGYQATQA